MKKWSGYLGLILMLFVGFLLLRTFLYSPEKDKLVKLIDESVSDDAISRLQGAIKIPTISNEFIIDTTTFLKFQKYLQDTFPLVHSILQREVVNQFSLVYKWVGKNPTKKPALFLAHLDVVPVQKENESKWSYPPFSGELSNDMVLGRGTLDDKSTLISILEATETLLAEGFTPEEDIYFAFGHDEEVGGENGAIQMVEKFKKEGKSFSFIIDEGMVVITDGISGVNKSIGMIGLGEKGFLSLTLSVELENGGHSSMPPKETAITILSEALVSLKNNPGAIVYHDAIKQLFEKIGPEMKWPEKIFFANQWLFRPLITKSLTKSNAPNALLRTTYAPTIIEGGVQDNVLPASAKAIVNIRIIPGEDINSVIKHVKRVINDERVTVKVVSESEPSNPTIISSTDHPGYLAIQKSIYESFDSVVVAPSLVIGGTDSRHYEPLSEATYRFMPVKISNEDLKGIHGVNEQISVENYQRMIKFFKRLIRNFGGEA